MKKVNYNLIKQIQETLIAKGDYKEVTLRNPISTLTIKENIIYFYNNNANFAIEIKNNRLIDILQQFRKYSEINKINYNNIFQTIENVFKNSMLNPELPIDINLTTFFIGASTIIHLAKLFIGHASIFSIELENNISLRFNLFVYKGSTIVATKLIAYLIFIILSMIFYTVVNYLILDLQIPIPILSSALIFINYFLFCICSLDINDI